MNVTMFVLKSTMLDRGFGCGNKNGKYLYKWNQQDLNISHSALAARARENLGKLLLTFPLSEPKLKKDVFTCAFGHSPSSDVLIVICGHNCGTRHIRTG